jgi:hypothetical protein
LQSTASATLTSSCPPTSCSDRDVRHAALTPPAPRRRFTRRRHPCERSHR